MDQSNGSMVRPLPGNLHELCSSLKHTGDERKWQDDCSRLMGEHGSAIAGEIDKFSNCAILIGIVAAYMQGRWHSNSYELLTEWLTQKPGEVMSLISIT
jgi:hypothetical protein